jgi:GNAT superfamily N-acetyltransferase
MSAPFLLRPATANDRAPVLAFCAHTWEGGDYIAEVWDEWLDDPHTWLVVGTLDEQPIALAHIVIDGEQSWLEGVRIDPARRGRGFGQRLVQGCAEIARQQGATVMRLLTNRDNRAMIQLITRIGFAHCFDAAWHSAPPLDGPPPMPLTTRDADDLLRDLAAAPVLRETGGLYADGWMFLRPSAARLRRYLAAGQIVAVPGVDGWAIVADDGESERQAIILAVGDFVGLLHGLRAHPAVQGSGELRILLPPDGACAALARQRGYAVKRPHRFGIYALSL